MWKMDCKETKAEAPKSCVGGPWVVHTSLRWLTQGPMWGGAKRTIGGIYLEVSGIAAENGLFLALGVQEPPWSF